MRSAGIDTARTWRIGRPAASATAGAGARKTGGGLVESLKETVAADRYSIFVFDKINFPCENILHADDGDFVVATGTLLYRNIMGTSALRALYDDFDAHDRSPRAPAGMTVG